MNYSGFNLEYPPVPLFYGQLHLSDEIPGKGSCTYYVITFGGPKSPPPLCNIVIIVAYPPMSYCNHFALISHVFFGEIKQQIFGLFSAFRQNVKTAVSPQFWPLLGPLSMWVIFLVAQMVPPSFVDHGPKLRVLIIAVLLTGCPVLIVTKIWTISEKLK